MLPDVARLLNYRVEQTVIFNEITQDNIKILEDKRNDNFKLHRLDSSMEEALSTFQSAIEVEQQNGRPQQKRHLSEKRKIPSLGQNRNRGQIKPSRDSKEFKTSP